MFMMNFVQETGEFFLFDITRSVEANRRYEFQVGPSGDPDLPFSWCVFDAPVGRERIEIARGLAHNPNQARWLLQCAADAWPTDADADADADADEKGMSENATKNLGHCGLCCNHCPCFSSNCSNLLQSLHPRKGGGGRVVTIWRHAQERQCPRVGFVRLAHGT